MFLKLLTEHNLPINSVNNSILNYVLFHIHNYGLIFVEHINSEYIVLFGWIEFKEYQYGSVDS